VRSPWGIYIVAERIKDTSRTSHIPIDYIRAVKA